MNPTSANMSRSTNEKNDAVRPPPRRAIVGDIEAMQRTTNIDRRQCSRVVPLKILCLGLSRTGTSCQSSFANHAHEEQLMSS